MGLFVEAGKPSAQRTPAEKQLGEYFAACMDEAAIDAKGAKPLAPALESLAAVTDLAGLTRWMARGHLEGGDGLLFGIGSEQDASDSTHYIAMVYGGGLGLPEQEDYFASGAKSIELRQRYHAHVAKLLTLLGDDAETAKATADLVMRLELELAKATVTRLERRNPHEVFHRMNVKDLEALAPAVDWKSYFEAVGLPRTKVLDVTQPKFFQRLSVLLQKEPLES